MTEIKYYHKGVMVFDSKLIKRIIKDSKLCRWHDSDEMIDKTFTGYKKGNQYYDICACLSRRSREEYEKKQLEYFEKFNYLKNLVYESMEIINNFLLSLDEISEINSNLRIINKKLEDGYVINYEAPSKSKRKRRFKKDCRRLLIESEISKLKENKQNLENLEVSLSKKIKLEEVLWNILKKIEPITKNKMYEYNNRFEWHETVGLYNDYEELMNKLSLKINHFTFNNLKEKYRLQNKEFDITLQEINTFEETLEKVKEKIEEDKIIEDMMTVKRERQVTKKAKFYLDENGNRVELDQTIDQRVIHN